MNGIQNVANICYLLGSILFTLGTILNMVKR